MREYRISEDGFVRANLHATARMRRILLWSCTALIILLGAQNVARPQALIAMLASLVVTWLFFLIAAPALNRWQFRRIYRGNELLHQPQFFDMQGELIQLRSSHGESGYRIHELKKVRLLPDMVLLYPATTYFHMVPRDILSESELNRLDDVADGGRS